MIVKRFKKIGDVSTPYYTQNNEEEIDSRLGKIRKSIEANVIDDEKYDLYRMIADQSKRIDVLEAIVKSLAPGCLLEPSVNLNDASVIAKYNEVNDRMKRINEILANS